MRQTKRNQSRSESSQRRSSQRSRLLIVENDHTVLELMKTVLSDRYDVAGPAKGRDVIDLAKTFRPHLILLDVNLREPMGPAICRNLRAHPDLQAIPILFMTELREEDSVLRGIHSEIDDWIKKPFEAPQLLERIESLLE